MASEEYKESEMAKIVKRLMDEEGFEFGEAVRELASDAGMQPYRFTKQDDEKQKRWKIYNLILGFGHAF